MKNLKFYLFLITVIKLLPKSSSSYLYEEFDENFKNKRISLRISFREFGSFILYGIDSDGNRLLIQTDYYYPNKQTIVNFNGILYNKSEMNYHNQIYTFELLLDFKQEHLNIDGKTRINDVYSNNFTGREYFQQYPIPINITNEKKKTFFWIGNIGPYKGYNNTFYEPLNDQVFGCVHYFVVNYKQIFLSEYGKYFVNSCEKYYYESLCQDGKCKKHRKNMNFLDCSLISIITNHFCYKDLSIRKFVINSYERIADYNESVSFKFVWRQKLLKHFCLIEIILKNNTSILFHINRINQLSMCFMRNLSEKCFDKSLYNITSTTIHILLIIFQYPHFIAKISNGTNVSTFIERLTEKINKINIGFSEYNSEICLKYQGEASFRYESSQFNQISKQTNYQVVLIGILSGINCVLIMIILFIFLLLRTRRRTNTSSMEQSVGDKDIASEIETKYEYFNNLIYDFFK